MTRSLFPWSFLEEADRKFSNQQRATLRRLELVPEQIALLEQILPECAFAVRKQPPKTDLRSKLRSIEKPLTEARKALETLRAGRSAAAGEALLSIRLVDVTPFDDRAGNGDEALGRAIDQALNVLSVAQSLRRTGQQRHKKAALFPIGKLAGVLEVGFREHHERSGNVPPRYTLRVSRSGEFRDIVSICYEAIGLPNTDPDRAIRIYLATKKVSRSQRSTARSRAKSISAGRKTGKLS